MINSDRVSAIVILVICSIFGYEVFSYSKFGAIFPEAVIVIMIIFSGALLIKSWVKPDILKSIFKKKVDIKYVFIVILSTIMWVKIITILGFYVTSVLFFLFLSWMLGKKEKNIYSIIFLCIKVICLTGLFYIVFKKFLLVPLPEGIFF